MPSPATTIRAIRLTAFASLAILGTLGPVWAAGSDCRRCSTNPQLACETNANCSASCPPGTCNPLPKTRPNIVMFVADDMGWADLPMFSQTPTTDHFLATAVTSLTPTDPRRTACESLNCGLPGLPACPKPNPACALAGLLDPVNQCPQCLTPKLEQLAANGVRFEHFYSGAPLCAPTRASIYTGRYGRRTGVVANESLAGLPGGERTIAEHLRGGCASGGVCYTTGLVGKWHNGWHDKAPWKQGFEEVVGFTQSQNQVRGRRWRCFPGQAPGEVAIPLLTDPTASGAQRIGPGLLRLDPSLVGLPDPPEGPSYGVCVDPDDKDHDGEMVVPSHGNCDESSWTCEGGSLPCAADTDCPFYGCIGNCETSGTECLTNGNCPAGEDCLHTSCTGSTRVGVPNEAEVQDIVTQDQRYATWVQRDAALAFIRRHKKDACPYFLVVPLRAPHAPTKGPFDRDRFDYVTGGKKWERGVWSSIQDLDTLIGDVVAEATTGDPNPEKTLILFLADNGKKHDNTILSGSKFQVEEGGIRVGLIARWDGDIPADATIAHRIGQTNDLLPTLAAAANAPLATVGSCLQIAQDDGTLVRVDGLSLLELLKAPTDPPAAPPSGFVEHDFMFFEFEGAGARSRQGFYESAGYGCAMYASKTGADPCTPDCGGGELAAWKVVKDGANFRLYDIAKDPGEMHNCLEPGPAAHASLRRVARDLCRRLAYWEKFTNGPNGGQRCVDNVAQGDITTEWTTGQWAGLPCLPAALESDL